METDLKKSWELSNKWKCPVCEVFVYEEPCRCCYRVCKCPVCGRTFEITDSRVPFELELRPYYDPIKVIRHPFVIKWEAI